MKIMKCKCGSENLELMVDATLSVPMDYYRKLSKTKQRIKLWGVRWNKSELFCSDCGNLLHNAKPAASRSEEISDIKDICEKYGYGNVMDVASALWALKEGHPVHMPSVEPFMTKEGKEAANNAMETRIAELKSLGYLLGN